MQADAELFIAVLPQGDHPQKLFEPHEFAQLLRILRVYDVAVDQEGHPLEMPKEFSEAAFANNPSPVSLLNL